MAHGFLTRKAHPTDTWSAYTEFVEEDGRRYEVRHPRAPHTTEFSLWEWDELKGWLLLGHYPSKDRAIMKALNRAQ